MKIAINRCFGGFSLSNAAVAYLAKLQGRECYFFSVSPIGDPKAIAADAEVLCPFAFDVPSVRTEDIRNSDWFTAHHIDGSSKDRANPLLIQTIEELGPQAASGRHAKLKIVKVPDGVPYTIEEYDGMEHVAEVHRIWG